MISYDPHSWYSHLFDVRGSMIREILWRVALCVGWATVVVLLHKQYGWFETPATLHALIGIALSLLLVFRTNSSYDRFWEGRKLWGGITNETRNLARLASVALSADPLLRDTVVRWTIAFSYAAMSDLRNRKYLGPQAMHLPADEVDAVLAAEQSAVAAAQRITSNLFEARRRELISDHVLMMLDTNTQLLVDYIGGCQRIHRTPLPYAYMVHLRRALILYCYTLPVALVRDNGYLTILWTFLTAYFFAGIEEIGVEIEDPFGEEVNDLPLEQFCQTIERNLLELIGRGPDMSTSSAVS